MNTHKATFMCQSIAHKKLISWESSLKKAEWAQWTCGHLKKEWSHTVQINKYDYRLKHVLQADVENNPVSKSNQWGGTAL